MVVGGGSGGLTAAARLLKAMPADVAIIEPSTKHYYQPLWTLVGAGVFPKQRSEREEADYIPKGATWIKDAVTEFEPEDNTVVTTAGERISYAYLIVAAGLQLDWDKVKGLEGNLGTRGICSNCAYVQCEKVWQTIQGFTGGTALFTMPPIKCAGAPQKIAYLADSHFRNAGVRERTKIIYAAGTPGIFGPPVFAVALNKVVERKGIETMLRGRA